MKTILLCLIASLTTISGYSQVIRDLFEVTRVPISYSGNITVSEEHVILIFDGDYISDENIVPRYTTNIGVICKDTLALSNLSKTIFVYKDTSNQRYWVQLSTTNTGFVLIITPIQPYTRKVYSLILTYEAATRSTNFQY